jgi:hypothetical protein
VKRSGKFREKRQPDKNGEDEFEYFNDGVEPNRQRGLLAGVSSGATAGTTGSSSNFDNHVTHSAVAQPHL